MMTNLPSPSQQRALKSDFRSASKRKLSANVAKSKSKLSHRSRLSNAGLNIVEDVVSQKSKTNFDGFQRGEIECDELGSMDDAAI